MTRLLIILPLFVLFLPCSVAAQEETPWLSLSRLSVTAATSYHFSPWKKYNESLQLAQDAIRYSPSYSSPKGSFEKILGDGSIELNLGYRLIEGLSLNVAGGYTSTNSQLIFSNTEYFIRYPEETRFPVESTINQKIKFDVIGVGFGLQYNFEIIDGIQLIALVNVHKNYAVFNFEYEYQRRYDSNAHGTLYFYSAKLQDTRMSVNAGFGSAAKIYGSISISALLEYRWLRFSELRGNGTYVRHTDSPTYSDEESHEFTAGLGEGGGYFTLEIDEENKWYTNDYLLYRIWSGGEVRPLFEKRSPATIDLSGIGITIGISYEF